MGQHACKDSRDILAACRFAWLELESPDAHPSMQPVAGKLRCKYSSKADLSFFLSARRKFGFYQGKGLPILLQKFEKLSKLWLT